MLRSANRSDSERINSGGMPSGKARLGQVLAGLALGLLFVSPAVADWSAVAGDLGRDESRLLLFGGGSYGVLGGSEVEDTDPTFGYEAGAGYRLWRGITLTGSWAAHTADVDGQLVQLLDVRVREDGRSGRVLGQIETSRFRAGLRLDPLGNEGWRYHPYVEVGVMHSTIEVTIDSVNGAPPVPFLQTPDDAELTDISVFDDTQLGGMARFGVEVDVMGGLGFDLGSTFEIIEFPAGTNSITTFGGRLVFRI